MTPPHILNKIHAAQRDQTKELDLSRQSLTHVPHEVFELTHLEKLSLSANKITEIPAEINRLTQLQRLDVRENPLRHLGDARGLIMEFQQYTRLAPTLRPEQIAGICFTYPQDVPDEIPVQLLKCRNLAVWALDVTELTPELEWLRPLNNITTLNLFCNGLTTLPEWLGGLTNLTSLDIGFHSLTTLPAWLGGLTNLTSLNLSGNKLTTLPEWLDGLTNLTSLDLGYNNLTTLPEWLGGLTNLTSLDLGYNNLTTLPEWLGGLTNLTSLNISGNLLTDIPDVIYTLKSLRTLSLENVYLYDNENQITTLSPKLLQLENLEELDVTGNPITTPPPDIVEKGLEAIKEYFRQTQEQGTVPLYAAKVLLVGEPGAGKTRYCASCLTRPIRSRMPNRNQHWVWKCIRVGNSHCRANRRLHFRPICGILAGSRFNT